MNGWLDGKLSPDVNFTTAGPYDGLYATSAIDAKTGDVIVKVVNAHSEAVPTTVKLTGVSLAGKGTAIVLTAASPEDGNSLAEPTKGSP